MNLRIAAWTFCLAGITLSSAPLGAEQLFRGDSWSAVASDRKAAGVGDAVTVVILEATRASSRLENNSSRKSQTGGGFQAGGIDESASLQFGGSYSGRGEVVRAEQFVAQMTATVIERTSAMASSPGSPDRAIQGATK